MVSLICWTIVLRAVVLESGLELESVSRHVFHGLGLASAWTWTCLGLPYCPLLVSPNIAVGLGQSNLISQKYVKLPRPPPLTTVFRGRDIYTDSVQCKVNGAVAREREGAAEKRERDSGGKTVLDR